MIPSAGVDKVTVNTGPPKESPRPLTRFAEACAQIPLSVFAMSCVCRAHAAVKPSRTRQYPSENFICLPFFIVAPRWAKDTSIHYGQWEGEEENHRPTVHRVRLFHSSGGNALRQRPLEDEEEDKRRNKGDKASRVDSRNVHDAVALQRRDCQRYGLSISRH